jgi:hypothetical protein
MLNGLNAGFDYAVCCYAEYCFAEYNYAVSQ